MLIKGSKSLQNITRKNFIAGLNRTAKKMNIDCAQAMTGWEFSGGSSHPVSPGKSCAKLFCFTLFLLSYLRFLMALLCVRNLPRYSWTLGTLRLRKRSKRMQRKKKNVSWIIGKSLLRDYSCIRKYGKSIWVKIQWKSSLLQMLNFFIQLPINAFWIFTWVTKWSKFKQKFLYDMTTL